jgi:hypothetical protein
MTIFDKPTKVNWDIKLNFELPKVEEKLPPPPPPKIPPRHILKEKFPRILERIELLWGSKELHNYFEHTLFTDRSNRQGFPEDVMVALGELHNEHFKLLKLKKVLSEDVWDLLFRK